jgi:DNA-binding GntR family transcriptional regulator
MSGKLTVRPVRHRTLRSNVVQTLREAIQQHRLAPGMRLSDSELAAQLGVSHSTVREALHQLTHERLVVNAPHRGFFVAGFTLDDLVDLLEMRGLLEGRIAEAVATELTDDDFARLAAAAAAMGRIGEGEISTFWDADRAFHEIILQRCAKTVLVELWNSLSSRLTMLEILFHDTFVSGLGSAQEHHLGYVEELRARDPVRARRAAEDHYRSPVGRLREAQARGERAQQ